MNLKKIIREEINNDLQWINDINPIPEIKIGTCFVDEMSGGLKGGKWIIKSIREKPSVTIIEVVNSKGKSVTLNKKYFEDDLINGRYKGCGKSIKESDDFEWARQINPNPQGLKNLEHQEPGRYKIWLGDISKEQQLKIIKYLIDKIKNNDEVVEGNKTLGMIYKDILSDYRAVHSLYFEIDETESGLKRIMTTGMFQYLRDKSTPKEEFLQRSRDYFDGVKSQQPETELMWESEDLDWIKDIEADELTVSPYISFRDDNKMRHIVKNFVDDIDDIDEDLLFNLATDLGYRWSEKHQGWWHSDERVDPKSIKESNYLQWINDVKSDEDVAQEIIDKTEIVKDTDGNIRIGQYFYSHPGFEVDYFYNDSATYFIEHLENYYGIEDLKHVSRIWKRYKKGVATKIDKELGSVNESNDFSWVDEIPQYDFHNGYYYIDISELDEDETCEVQQLILDMGIDWEDSKGLQTGHCNTFINKGYIIRNATLYRTTKNWDDYMEVLGRTKSRFNDYGSITYIDGRTDLLS